MNSSSSSRLDAHRAALELVFWAAREFLKLAVSTAATVYCIVSMIHGELPWARDLLAVVARLFGS